MSFSSLAGFPGVVRVEQHPLALVGIRRAAEGAVLTINWLDDADNALSEIQQIELVSTVMHVLDGVQHEIHSTLKRDASTSPDIKLVEDDDAI